MIYKKDKLTIDGVDIGFLARRFKTPIYCYAMGWGFFYSIKMAPILASYSDSQTLS